MTTFMSCSMSRIVSPRSSRSLRMKSVRLVGLLRVHPGRRLVEQQQLRVGRERAGDLDAALVAVGEVDGELVVDAWRPAPTKSSISRALSSDSRSSRRVRGGRRIEPNSPARMRACRPTITFSTRGHRREQADVLERPRHAQRRDLVRPRAGDVRAVELDLAQRRLVEAGEHVEERRLAGAVGPDDRDDRALGDLEGDVVDGDEAAEDLRHVRRRGAAPRRRLRRRARARAVGAAGVVSLMAGSTSSDGVVDADALGELELAPSLGDQALGSQDHHDAG